MKTEHFIKLGRITAIASLVIGTFILIAYYLSDKEEFQVLGFLFMIGAFFFNCAVLVSLLLRLLYDLKAWRKLLLTCALMLLNIPFALLYAALGTQTPDESLTIRNNTKDTITDIHLAGCINNSVIFNLLPGQEKRLDFKIPGDCDLSINYRQNGNLEHKVVIGYLTPGMSYQGTYNIGGPNERH